MYVKIKDIKHFFDRKKNLSILGIEKKFVLK